MNLKIDCKNVKTTPTTDLNGQLLLTIEVEGEECYSGQLEHYLDYLSEKYGRDLIVELKNRFGLVEE